MARLNEKTRVEEEKQKALEEEEQKRIKLL